MLDWIVWNRIAFDIKAMYSYSTELFEIEVLLFNWTVLTFNSVETKKYTYTKLNCLKFISALNDPKRVDMP